MNVTHAELAARASISVKHVNQIMQGNAPITPETAMILDRITGTPVGFWNRREADYRENLLGITPKTLSPEDPLTAQGDPNEMVNICAEAGVVVVFVPEVQRCRIRLVAPSFNRLLADAEPPEATKAPLIMVRAIVDQSSVPEHSGRAEQSCVGMPCVATCPGAHPPDSTPVKVPSRQLPQ